MTTIDRRYSVAEGLAVKAPCRVATTANISLTGLQTIDGVTLAEDDRVLVKDQTDGRQNGIYSASTGNWLRTRDFDGALDIVSGTRVFVYSGNTNAGIEFYVSTIGAITIDTTSIAFSSILSVAVIAAAVVQASLGLSWTTGDAKLTYKTAADTGWILLDDGSIGDGSSGATTRANADTSALFTLFYNGVSALVVQDSSGSTVSRGVSAAADFAAHRRLVIPKVLGRAIAIAGLGSGLTSRTLGGTAGAETHTLEATEVPPVTFSGTTGSDTPDHTHDVVAARQSGAASDITPGSVIGAADGTRTSGGASTRHQHPFSGTTDGGGQAHNNVQPSAFMNIMVKL